MADKSKLKATLKVQLFADTVLVTESDDPTLWQEVFSAIQSGVPTLEGEEKQSAKVVSPSNDSKKGQKLDAEVSATVRFAADLNITNDDAIGACRPSETQPYLFLDDHYWEMFKKNIPPRGPNSVAPIALSAALLSIWFKHSKIEASPTIKQCQDVLGTIHLSDKNVTRSIKNTSWLQRKGNHIIINPSMRSKAVAVARAYCLRQGIDKSEI